MDLIYADANKKDIGILDAYNLDLAYGTDENDFECKIDRASHCCEAGFFLYVEGEEYGGIIDAIKVVTDAEEITYSGRTWHGVLESKVICPQNGVDYLLLNGEANVVLGELIKSLGLTGLFKASKVDSGIAIQSYQMNRYVYGYTGIKQMLKEFDAKLKLKWKNGFVELSAESIADYSQDEEFDTSQVDFTIKKQYRPVNHIICLGKGDLKDRAVIHIFSDENGGIQPYAKVETPLRDADYILDESKKVLFGENEIIEIYDYPNAEITENYIALYSKPDNWNSNCEDYYERNENGNYDSVKKVKLEGYAVQTSQPSDWYTNYGNYFTISENQYVAVEGVTADVYVLQTAQPSDWATKYSEYYYYYSDGVTSEYRTTEGVTKYKYVCQTVQPTDWSDNYTSYYRKATAKELKKNSKKKYYSVEGVSKTVNKKKTTVAPTWKAKKYYVRQSYQVAPAWNEKTRYILTKTTAAPIWIASTYYSKYESINAPTWISGIYFMKVDDRYAVIVAEAIKKLTEYHQSDELSIALEETEQTYDIGDLVGTIENTTGISAVQEVVKKIIKIVNDEVSITYEVN